MKSRYECKTGCIWLRCTKKSMFKILINTYGINCSNPWLLRGRIQSRHSRSRIYYVYILIEDHLEGRNAVLSHYCSCVVGKRTLGCCSHIMSIMWYLGWGRYQNNLSPPAQFLDSIIIRHDVENEAYMTNLKMKMSRFHVNIFIVKIYLNIFLNKTSALLFLFTWIIPPFLGILINLNYALHC